MSQKKVNRICGGRILRALKMKVGLVNKCDTFALSDITTLKEQFVYLATKDYKINQVNNKMTVDLEKELKLEYTDKNILTEDKETNAISQTYKTAENIEVDIVNIEDFYKNIVSMSLSPEWYKRNGAFIGLCQIVNNIGDVVKNEEFVDENVFEVDINELVRNALVIIQHDKFNDYLDNKTSSPVREEACRMIVHILKKEMIIESGKSQTVPLSGFVYAFFFDIIVSSCWHTQLTSLFFIKMALQEKIKREVLIDLIKKHIETFYTLLESTDEDIKYTTAEIITELISYRNKNRNSGNTEEFKLDNDRIASIILTNLRSTDLIAYSKSQMIHLLSLLDFNLDSSALMLLAPCFTSDIPEIRESVISMFKEGVNEPEVIYILTECILLDSYDNRTLDSILTSKLHLATPEYLGHYLNILSSSPSIPYISGDFILSDENYFTPDGWKVTGIERITDNRMRVIEIVKGCTEKAVGELASYLPDIKTVFSSTIRQILSPSLTSTVFISPDSLKTDFKHFTDLNVHYLNEFVSVINDSDKLHYSKSHRISCRLLLIEYLRMCVLRNIHNNFDFSMWYALDYSTEMVKYVSRKIKEKKNNKKMNDKMMEKLLKCVSGEEESTLRRNTKLYFTEIYNLSTDSTGNNNSEPENNPLDNLSQGDLILFHSEIPLPKSSKILSLCLSECFENSLILPHHIRLIDRYLNDDIRYQCEYTSIVLNNITSSVFTELISRTYECLDYSFYVLLVKPLISKIETANVQAKPKENKDDVTSKGKKIGGLLDGFDDVIKSQVTIAPTYNSVEVLGKIIAGLNVGTNSKIQAHSTEIYSKIKLAYDEIELIINPNKIHEIEITNLTNLSLRDYQKEGIRWIDFLFRFNLGGILADDMGLGKTIQVLNYILSQKGMDGVVKTLILCPNSLLGHWKEEILTKFNTKQKDLRVTKGGSVMSVNIEGSDQLFSFYIRAYESLARSSAILDDVDHDFIIYDEGHILRNKKTILYTNVSKFNAPHRLILTGTPIHNSIDDLYTLFNIILPGYLGDEKTFNKKYKFRKQPAAETNNKSNDKKQSDNSIFGDFSVDKKIDDKIQLLHKKVLPFILRRLKSEVLKDLPPKIIKDVIVRMDDQHKKLYESISNVDEESSTISPTDDNSKNLKMSEISYGMKNPSALKILHSQLKCASNPRAFGYTGTSCKLQALVDIIGMCGGINGMRNKMIIFFSKQEDSW